MPIDIDIDRYQKGYIRGHLAASGFFIQADKENPNHSVVSYIYQVGLSMAGFIITSALQGSFKGNIPKFVEKKTAVKRVKVLRKMREVLESIIEQEQLQLQQYQQPQQPTTDNNNSNTNTETNIDKPSTPRKKRSSTKPDVLRS